MRLKYEYKIKKIAYVPGEKGQLVAVGVFEESSREEDTCRMTVKLFNNLPDELINLLKENPQILSMKENKLKATSVVILPDALEGIIIPGGHNV